MLKIINSVLLFFGNRAAVQSLVIGFIVGLLLGWFPLNYMAPTIEWKDAAPIDLHPGYRQMYLEMLASYNAQKPLTGQQLNDRLGDRWAAPAAITTLGEMVKDTTRTDQAQLQALSNALNAAPVKTVKSGGTSPVCFGLVFLVLVIIFGMVFVVPRLTGREAGFGGIQAPKIKVPVPSMGAAGKVVAPEEWVGIAEKPVSQFVTSYELGDNRYDMSFSIESGPDFLGECGVAISETIGVGDPDKVTALEVWVFDKNDIRTVTKVLMSDYCYNDQALRAKLAPKGEAVLIEPDGSVDLDTQTLKLRARVVSLEYGSGALPPNSFFNKVTLELAGWPKTV